MLEIESSSSSARASETYGKDAGMTFCCGGFSGAFCWTTGADTVAKWTTSTFLGDSGVGTMVVTGCGAGCSGTMASWVIAGMDSGATEGSEAGATDWEESSTLERSIWPVRICDSYSALTLPFLISSMSAVAYESDSFYWYYSLMALCLEISSAS
jgi:hypothetical protein